MAILYTELSNWKQILNQWKIEYLIYSCCWITGNQTENISMNLQWSNSQMINYIYLASEKH